MRTYYFDMKDGIPSRDRTGLEFATASGAIEHSKELARRLRHDPRITDRALFIVVIDEAGVEIHREPVHTNATKPDISKIHNPTASSRRVVPALDRRPAMA